MIYAGSILLKLGAKNVLVKGGHRNTKHMEDILLNKLFLFLVLFSYPVHAHTFTGMIGFYDGISHPVLGLDHFLAMVCVIILTLNKKFLLKNQDISKQILRDLNKSFVSHN